jgi:hypothetical protein
VQGEPAPVHRRPLGRHRPAEHSLLSASRASGAPERARWPLTVTLFPVAPLRPPAYARLLAAFRLLAQRKPRSDDEPSAQPRAHAAPMAHRQDVASSLLI